MTVAHEQIVKVTDAVYPNGQVEHCYALACPGEDGEIVGIAITTRRAIDLQNEGVPYDTRNGLSVDSFDRFYPPDFRPLGSPRPTAPKGDAA